MKTELLDKLYEELPVSIKPGGQGFKFIKTKDVINRLNRTFEGNWQTLVVSSQMIGNEYLVHVRVSRLDGEGKTLSSHDGFGSALHYDKNEIGNTHKSAKSKAIKDAAKSFGVGLMLNTGRGDNSNYASDADATANSAITAPPTQNGFAGTTPPTGFQGTETAPTQMPPTRASVTDNPVTNNPVTSNPVTSNTAQAPPVQTPITSAPPSGSFPVTQKLPEEQQPADAPPQPQGLPPMQNNNTPPQSGSITPTPQTPNNSGDMSTAKITHIQKIVFEERVKESGLTFKEYVTGKFAEVGHTVDYTFDNVDDLLYKDALLIVANQ